MNGIIDTYNTPFLSKKVNMAISRGFIRLIFDLTKVTYMSSTALGIFTSFLKLLKPIKGDLVLVLVGVQPKLYEVFQLIGFNKFFKFSESVNKAVSMLRPEKDNGEKSVVNLFPKTFRCSCRKKLRVTKSGIYKCPQCQTRISVGADGSLKRV